MKHHLIAAAIFGLSAGAAHAVTFSGTAQGSWVDPIGSFGFTIANNDAGETADVDWGTPATTNFNNLWRFDGVGSDGGPGWTADAGNLFKVGDFTYRNGSVTGHDFDGASLAVTLFIINPLNVTESFSFAFDVLNTPNVTGDPVLDGDIASIANISTSATFMYGGLDYTLELPGFSQDGGARRSGPCPAGTSPLGLTRPLPCQPKAPRPGAPSPPGRRPYPDPIRMPAASTSPPPSTTWKAARRKGVSI